MKRGKLRRRGRITNKKVAGGYLSDAMACDPSQVDEFNAEYKEHGITGVRHLEDGTAFISSRRDRAEVMKLRGMIDKDAGYGDYAGR